MVKQVVKIHGLIHAHDDFERILGMPRGHEHHGEMSLDQLFFMRPAPHYADYRSPVRALYQCGSSTHPAGGVTGVPGHNAAREIMKDWKKLKRNKTRKGGYNDGKN